MSGIPGIVWVALGFNAVLAACFWAVCTRMQARGITALAPHPGRRCKPKTPVVYATVAWFLALAERAGLTTSDVTPAAREVSR